MPDPLVAHVSLVTLGVRDVARATRFYEAMGWVASSASNEHVTFLHAKGSGAALALWGRDALAEDARVPAAPPGSAAVALAANVPQREDVDRALEAARQAGARVTKPAEDTFWGGRSGYYADPDDHLWEVAWNPGFPLRPDGSVELPRA